MGGIFVKITFHIEKDGLLLCPFSNVFNNLSKKPILHILKEKDRKI